MRDLSSDIVRIKIRVEKRIENGIWSPIITLSNYWSRVDKGWPSDVESAKTA